MVYNARWFYNLTVLHFLIYIYIAIYIHMFFEYVQLHTYICIRNLQRPKMFSLSKADQLHIPSKPRPTSLLDKGRRCQELGYLCNPAWHVHLWCYNDGRVGTFRRHSHLMIFTKQKQFRLIAECIFKSEHEYRHGQRDGIRVLMICTHMCHLYIYICNKYIDHPPGWNHNAQKNTLSQARPPPSKKTCARQKRGLVSASPGMMSWTKWFKSACFFRFEGNPGKQS